MLSASGQRIKIKAPQLSAFSVLSNTLSATIKTPLIEEGDEV